MPTASAMVTVRIEDLPAPALVTDAAGLIFAANAHAARLYGRDVTGEPAPVGSRTSDSRDAIPFTAEIAASGLPGGGRLLLLTEVTGWRLLDEAGRMLDAAFDGVPLGMALYNPAGEFIRVNRAMCELLGRDADGVLGLRDQALTHPDDRQTDVDAAAAIFAGRITTHHCEKRFLRPDGTVAWALANLVFLHDDGGHPLCWVGTFQDVTARKRAEHRLRHLADHDPLTGVANRRRLVADLELHVAHAGRDNERGAVIVLDLDGFKAVNDSQGHEAGDAVLATVAISMKRRLRVTDVLGRLGGDEFAIVLPHVDGDGARIVADELRAAVAEAAPRGVTASCGIALYGDGSTLTAGELLALADRAMYAAKRAGRDAAVLA